MALEIKWSGKAEKRLDEIVEILKVKWGNRPTNTFVRKVFELVNLLSVFPEMGTMEHAALNIRAFVIVRQITLFYQVRENEIVLLNFYDNRQDPANKMF